MIVSVQGYLATPRDSLLFVAPEGEGCGEGRRKGERERGELRKQCGRGGRGTEVKNELNSCLVRMCVTLTISSRQLEVEG